MSVLGALKTIFYGERFVPADAVPRALLKQLATIPRLTGILPYLGWLPDEQLFVLDQGAFGEKPGQALGFCIETVPQTGSNEAVEKVGEGLRYPNSGGLLAIPRLPIGPQRAFYEVDFLGASSQNFRKGFSTAST